MGGVKLRWIDKERLYHRRLAYATALDWFRRLPAEEVKERLEAKVREIDEQLEAARGDR